MVPFSTAFVLSLFDTGLGAIRSLGREGIPVVGLDSNPTMPGFRSKFCVPKLCPDPVHQPEELVQFLRHEGQRLDEPGMLFPASDAFVLFLSRYRNDLSEYFSFILPQSDVLEAIVNKRRQYELAEKVGTPYAPTFYPETIEDIHRIKGEIDYPVIIKPYYGHLWRATFGGVHKGFRVNSPQELEKRFESILPTGLQVAVQSIILGPNTNHYKINVYIGVSGQPLAVFTLRKIRQYPTEFGVGTLVESLYMPELVDLGLAFFQGIGYRGIGSIEFKRDDRDGKLKMIELNPRLWQQNALATKCGINFPLIQYLDLNGCPPNRPVRFVEGIKWVDIMSDFQAFWDYHRQGRLSLLEWLTSLYGTTTFSSFALDDPVPFLRKNEGGAKLLRLPMYLMRHRKG